MSKIIAAALAVVALTACAGSALAKSAAERDAQNRTEITKVLQDAKARYAGHTIWFRDAPLGKPEAACNAEPEVRCDFFPDLKELSGPFRVLTVTTSSDCRILWNCNIWFKTDRPGKLAYLGFNGDRLKNALQWEADSTLAGIVLEDPAVTATKLDEQPNAECDRKGAVSIGMTKEQVLASCWGKAWRVNTTTVANGRLEQWIYNGSNYLYLDNGVVTGIQTSKQ